MNHNGTTIYKRRVVTILPEATWCPSFRDQFADEQIDDLIDDALQYFYERHFDGAERSYIKYQITQADIDRARSQKILLQD